MKKFLFICLFLVAVASLGSANKLPNVTVPALPPSIPTENPIELIGELSPQCQAAFLSIVANPEFFQCVPVAALLPALTDPTFIPSIIQDPIKNGAKLLPIFDAICADPKCSDKGVAAALKAVETGCAADLSNPIVQLAIGVLTFYSPARDIICFKDNKDEYCLVESITNILALPPPPIKLLGGVIDSVAFAEPKFVCTPCNKAIVNTLIIFFGKHPEAVQILELGFHIGEEELVLAKFGVAIKCGSPFVDGKVGDPTTPPDKFEYQEAGNSTKSDASKLNGLGVMMISSLVATALILN